MCDQIAILEGQKHDRQTASASLGIFSVFCVF